LRGDGGWSLELVCDTNDAYPTLVRRQDVINRQIPLDYDIFVGVMWKAMRHADGARPKRDASSQEFRRAVR